MPAILKTGEGARKVHLARSCHVDGNSLETFSETSSACKALVTSALNEVLGYIFQEKYHFCSRIFAGNMSDRIHVAIRVRPLNAREEAAGSAWTCDNTSISQLNIESNRPTGVSYTFGTNICF